MDSQACIAFLQWCLPRLGLRWSGYRKVRRLVGKRLNRRLAEVGVADLSAYRTYLASTPAEWARLDAMCRIPISRFCRDRGVFEIIIRQVLPEVAALAIARGHRVLKCWSAGCASGEESYTVAIAWRLCLALDWPALELSVTGTDADEIMIERAERACYGHSALKELPPEWIARAFIRQDSFYCVAPEFRGKVEFVLQDIRRSMLDGPFDLILCRNLVFTYFDEPVQRHIADQLCERLRPGGVLVLGSHEALPADIGGFAPIGPKKGLYRRYTDPGSEQLTQGSRCVGS